MKITQGLTRITLCTIMAMAAASSPGWCGPNEQGGQKKENTSTSEVKGSNPAPKASSGTDAASEALIAAVTKNDSKMVQELISKGAPVDAKDADGNSLLTFAIHNQNFELARWLIAHGASIDFMAFLVCNPQPNSPGYSADQESLLADMVTAKLLKQGMKLKPENLAAKTQFVKNCKEAIISYMKDHDLFPKDVTGWTLRIVDVVFKDGFGSSFLVRCDIAMWNAAAMYELVSKSGLTFQAPQQLASKGVFSHVWMYRPSTESGSVVLSTSYDDQKVTNGDFYVTVGDGNSVTAKRLNYSEVIEKGLEY
ncbi:MAG: ankyrin repeat domain-containing protein [Candidatus Omnitrophica bacterium]|nr:ankyrin repeat domain-containing protein [Candidatus Omnitrophota bacterium]